MISLRSEQWSLNTFYLKHPPMSLYRSHLIPFVWIWWHFLGFWQLTHLIPKQVFSLTMLVVHVRQTLILLYLCLLTGWATATGDVDYSVKLVFSDDEDNTTTTTSSSQSRATAGRDGGDKRSSQPDQMSKSVDRSRGDRSPDRRSQSEQRAGREYDTERDRGRAPPPMSVSITGILFSPKSQYIMLNSG